MTAVKIASAIGAATFRGPFGACGSGAQEAAPRPAEPVLLMESDRIALREHARPALAAQQLAELPAGQMTPFAEELLDRPIELEGCPGVRVVEWRPTPGREATPAPTGAAVEVLSSVCAIAVDEFERFLAGEMPFPVPAPDRLALRREPPLDRARGAHRAHARRSRREVRAP